MHALSHVPPPLPLSASYFQYGYGFGAWWATVLVTLAGLSTCCAASCKGGIITAAIFATAGLATAVIGACDRPSAPLIVSTHMPLFPLALQAPSGTAQRPCTFAASPPAWCYPPATTTLSWSTGGIPATTKTSSRCVGDNAETCILSSVVHAKRNTTQFPSQCMGRGNDDALWVPSLIGPSGSQRGSCVCIQFGTYKCAQFRLSQSTLKANQNCGNILDVYSSTLASSAGGIHGSIRSNARTDLLLRLIPPSFFLSFPPSPAFCAASGLAALLLASMTCFMICCNSQREIGETEFEKQLQYGPSSTAAINDRSGQQEI